MIHCMRDVIVKIILFLNSVVAAIMHQNCDLKARCFVPRNVFCANACLTYQVCITDGLFMLKR